MYNRAKDQYVFDPKEIMPSVTPRFELKYLISEQDAVILKSKLCGFLRNDIHSEGDNGYLVTSLYFDTPFMDFAHENENGIFERVKYRIRTYGEKSDFFRLERKAKRGNLCFKTSCSIDSTRIEGMEALLSDNSLCSGFLARRRTGLLKPSVIVRYNRRAFCFEPGRVRITIDQNLCAISATSCFPVNGNSSIPVLPGRSAILEVKFDNYLPDSVKSLLELPARPALSLSKYLLCLKAVQF